ncbi:MAG: cell division protein FtsA [Ignavibacteriaceae bacterium]|nr:cell division protein FtsA [Ignavibacteriaceae bacterium]
MKREIVTSLDIGTTKVVCVIAEKLPENKFNILGYGVAAADGLNRGVVVNTGRVADAIKQAVSAASKIAGVEVEHLNVGVSGDQVTSMRLRAYVTVSSPLREVTQSDLERLKADVKMMPKPAEKEILHIIHEEFFVDRQAGYRNPIGITGSRLEASNHIVVVPQQTLQNLRAAVERAGYKVKEFILASIASANAVLNDREKDLGVLVMDIGAGTIETTIYHDNNVKYSRVFVPGSEQVTNDIRETLGVINIEAERLKKDSGYAISSAVLIDEEVLIKGVGARRDTTIPITLLCQIIHYRMKELIEYVESDVKQSHLKTKLLAGIFITGGGSWLRGCEDLVKSIFGIECRMALPSDKYKSEFIEILKPEFATALGLLESLGDPIIKEEKEEKESEKEEKSGFMSIFGKSKKEKKVTEKEKEMKNSASKEAGSEEKASPNPIKRAYNTVKDTFLRNVKEF